MTASLYSLEALNKLALSDTGHFVYLDSWSIGAFASIFAQIMPLYHWTNDQNPMTQAQIDELEAKLAKAMGQIMHPLVGLIIAVGTVNIPEGTLLCDGSNYARSDYPNLYDALDPALHVDADTFTVPDLRDRFIIGASATKAPLSTGGSFDHVQTVAEMAAHTHTAQPHTHSDTPHTHAEGNALPAAADLGTGVPVPSAVPSVGVTGPASVGILPATVTIDSAGSGNAMDITNPYYALRYVMVAL